MIKKLLLMAGILAYSVLAIAQGNVSNIRIEQNDSLLYIFYDLDTKADISVYFSKDDGQSFAGPLVNLTGNTGGSVEAGKDKLVIWDVVNEVGYIDIHSAKIKITAKPIPQKPVQVKEKRVFTWKNLVMVGVSTSEYTPVSYSLMYARYKRFGGYAKVETNFKLFQKSEGEYYRNVFWDGTGSQSRIAAYMGGIWNFCRYAMLNLGAGYSNQKYYGNTIGGQTVQCKETIQDLNIELGLIGNYKMLSASVNAFGTPTYSRLGGGIPLGMSFSIGINF